jgi:putative transposase
MPNIPTPRVEVNPRPLHRDDCEFWANSSVCTCDGVEDGAEEGPAPSAPVGGGSSVAAVFAPGVGPWRCTPRGPRGIRKFGLDLQVLYCPKDRRSVIVGALGTRLKRLVTAKARAGAWAMAAFEVMPAYVRVFVLATPDGWSSSGRSTRDIRQEFLRLRTRLPASWSRSFFGRR